MLPTCARTHPSLLLYIPPIQQANACIIEDSPTKQISPGQTLTSAYTCVCVFSAIIVSLPAVLCQLPQQATWMMICLYALSTPQPGSSKDYK